MSFCLLMKIDWLAVNWPNLCYSASILNTDILCSHKFPGMQAVLFQILWSDFFASRRVTKENLAKFNMLSMFFMNKLYLNQVNIQTWIALAQVLKFSDEVWILLNELFWIVKHLQMLSTANYRYRKKPRLFLSSKAVLSSKQFFLFYQKFTVIWQMYFKQGWAQLVIFSKIEDCADRIFQRTHTFCPPNINPWYKKTLTCADSSRRKV